MKVHPEPVRVHNKGELNNRAQDRATKAKEMRGKGMSLRVIAADLGISKSMVRNYVGGVPIPSDTTLIARPRKPQPKRHTVFHISLSVAIYEAARASAATSGITIVEQCRQLIERGLAAKLPPLSCRDCKQYVEDVVTMPDSDYVVCGEYGIANPNDAEVCTHFERSRVVDKS